MFAISHLALKGTHVAEQLAKRRILGEAGLQLDDYQRAVCIVAQKCRSAQRRSAARVRHR